MPEKKADISSTPATPVPTQKKKPTEKTNALSFDSESDSDRTLTDGGEWGSLWAFWESEESSLVGQDWQARHRPNIFVAKESKSRSVSQ